MILFFTHFTQSEMTSLLDDTKKTMDSHSEFLEKLARISADPKAPRSCPLSFKFSDGLLVNALREGHWLILDEVNLAPTDLIERLCCIAAPEANDFHCGRQSSIILLEDNGRVIEIHPEFRLFACMNPPVTPVMENNVQNGET